MTPQDRILDAALRVFRRHGYRRSSIEQAAEAAGLTRQALYHHFQSKEALFRAVIEQLYESALAAETAAADAAAKAGGSLADILVAQIKARLKHLIASFEGSPHIEELFSEHLAHGRDLYQKYAAAFAAQIAATIEQVCRKQRLALAKGMTASTLARYVEMAMHGAKSAYPSMLPADAFFKDLEVMLRTLVAGAVAVPSTQRSAKSIPDKTPKRKTIGKSLAKSLGRSLGRSLGKKLAKKPGGRR
jgi:AcrR family transcriptional regulator